ncbi:MAG: hypothetical protein RL431_38 [Actinomycetota bacterium]|jgi:hypothetical protein
MKTPESVIAPIADVGARISEWRAQIEQRFEASPTMTVAEVDELIERLVVPGLSGHSIEIGGGFVCAPGLLSDREYRLAWWLGRENTFGLNGAEPRVRMLESIEDPAAENFRDYTTLEWWRMPIQSGRHHVTGPYVDYMCTDDYTVTITEPVTVGGRVIGVVGADIYVRDLEDTLLAELSQYSPGSTLVNTAGRIVVSADSRHATGALLQVTGLKDALKELSDGEARTLPGGHRVEHISGWNFALISDGNAS